MRCPTSKKLHKKKKHRTEKLGVQKYKVRFQIQSNFLPVDIGEGLCYDKPDEPAKNLGGAYRPRNRPRTVQVIDNLFRRCYNVIEVMI